MLNYYNEYKMNTISKKYLLTTIVMLLSTITSFAYDFEVNGICYNYTYSGNQEETCAVTKNPQEKYSGIIVIPSSVAYKGKTYSVTSIGNSAFMDCSGLTSVIIPNSVTSIGSTAFCLCI